MKLNCLFISSSLLTLILSSLSIASDASHKDEFVRVLGQALRANRTRFQYEVDLIDDNKLRSMFIDEAYSRELKSGRAVLNHGAKSNRFAYSMYYWSASEKYYESHWLRPFVCSSSKIGINSGSIISGFSFTNMPHDLANLFVYFDPKEPDLSLHGFGAFLLNMFGNSSSDMQEVVTSKDDDNEHLSWSVSQLDYQIEISLTKSSRSPFRWNDLNRVVVSITKSKEQDVQLVAIFTVLSFSQYFDNQLTLLPPGYSCSHSGQLDVGQIATAKIPNMPRTKYTYEVLVTKGTQIPNHAFRLLSNHYSDYVPQPSDSLAKPETQAKTFEFLHDQFDCIVAVLNSRSKSHAVFRSGEDRADKIAAGLSVWDFNSRKRHKINFETGKCSPASTFVSSLFGAHKDTKVPSSFRASCTFEDVEVDLSDTLKLRLNEDGLKLLTFNFQDRANHMQLIDIQVDPSSGNKELVYERSVSDKLCLMDAKVGFIQYQAVRLVTRFLYQAGSDLMKPKSSSLLFFDSAQSQLMLQIDLNLLHLEPYEPWSSSRHFLDLSSCKTGHRQSARLRIEYPLSGANQLNIANMQEPHKAIRNALATNFRLSFGVTSLRLPAIEVQLTDDLVQVEMQLLERASLWSESEWIKVISSTSSQTVSPDKYLEQLNKATRSVLVDGVDKCADYCQLYQCEMFAYCSYVKECYIYTDPGVLEEDKFGSCRSLKLNCDAYRVPANRINAANEWRKNSWSLEEILDGCTDYINTQESDQLDPIRVPKSSKLTGLETSISFVANLKNYTTSRSVRLTPSRAEYHYDNPLSVAVTNDGQVNPFDLMNRKGGDKNELALANQPIEMVNNFKILKSGCKFVDSRSIQINPHDTMAAADADGWQVMNLDEVTNGFLTLENQRLDDCLRLCLNDLSCSSLSYCTDSTCTLTKLNSSFVTKLLTTKPEANLKDTHLRVQMDPRCTLVQRTYSDQFYQMDLRMLLSHNNRSSSEIIKVIKSDNIDDCATECALDRVASGLVDQDLNSCLSFDFCRPFRLDGASNYSSICILFKDHLVNNGPTRVRGDHKSGTQSDESLSDERNDPSSILEILRTNELNVSNNSYCTHHGRNYLADFYRLNRRRLPESMKTLTLSNFNPNKAPSQLDVDSPDEQPDAEDTSLARCANLCESDPNCGAFEYCVAKHSGAPHNLYLSCSLSDESSFELTPMGRASSLSQTGEMQLAQSQVCSVYLYKRFSYISGHKRKNLASLSRKIELESAEIYQRATWNLLRFDLVLLFVFFLLGFIIKDLYGSGKFALGRLRSVSQADASPIMDDDRLGMSDSNQISMAPIKRSG